MSQFESELNNSQCTNAVLENEKIILKPCKICNRTFNPLSLERHEKACEKLKKLNNRTVFNSFLQRAKETNGIPLINGKKGGKEEKEKGKTKHKEERENDLQIFKADKTNTLNKGTSPGKRTPGYQQCPSCKRFFNDKAADRHITWCQEQQTRLPKTPPSFEALERLRARTKYRAPLPVKRNQGDGNQRLVKSAESVRESSKLRTHSSPPLPTHQLLHTPKRNAEKVKITVQMQQKRNEKCTLFPYTNHDDNVPSTKQTVEYESKEKKSVKFKEKFPIYNKERNKNLNMLAALKLRLEKLNTSDEFLEPPTLSRCSENVNLNLDALKQYGFPVPIKDAKDSWSSDGEIYYSTSSSSNASLPSGDQAESYERRLPRFCYNCGTKYPIVSAKYCCECGARRFIFGSNDNQLVI
ncbi:zinc finger C2HC domain-containing protein 1A-like [Uloborus diversus]|uniref:zinc finger C2HC domain-containing protein 1A-like n=1 Tax=Uloborus diversus TaxID=327109 RepID=UPI0024094D95|nr:zinc finger C2HC domain-containing protein 1A-like [Uloborus diversus]